MPKRNTPTDSNLLQDALNTARRHDLDTKELVGQMQDNPFLASMISLDVGHRQATEAMAEIGNPHVALVYSAVISAVAEDLNQLANDLRLSALLNTDTTLEGKIDRLPHTCQHNHAGEKDNEEQGNPDQHQSLRISTDEDGPRLSLVTVDENGADEKDVTENVIQFLSYLGIYGDDEAGER